VQLPKLAEPEADNLTDEQVREDFSGGGRDEVVRSQSGAAVCLCSGIRAEAATLLNVGDFDGKRLWVRQDKADSKGCAAG